MKHYRNRKAGRDILRSDSGGATILVILLLLLGGYWYWSTYKAAPRTGVPAQQQASQPQAPAVPQEPVYDNPQDYVKNKVFFSGFVEGGLPRPGLILKINNSGDKDISLLSVKIIGYKKFFVLDVSKEQGAEYIVELEVKKFPAGKISDSVLYFPPGVQSIHPHAITAHDGRF